MTLRCQDCHAYGSQRRCEEEIIILGDRQGRLFHHNMGSLLRYDCNGVD